jgi:hypothetical protein
MRAPGVKDHAAYAAAASRAHAVAERTADPLTKAKWLRIEASYRALADGSLDARKLGLRVPEPENEAGPQRS